MQLLFCLTRQDDVDKKDAELTAQADAFFHSCMFIKLCCTTGDNGKPNV